MRLLYPSDPFQPKLPDENYREECDAAKAAGIAVSTFSFEDFESGTLKARPALQPGEVVLYRGWMLSPEAYANLVAAVEAQDARAFTALVQYRLCHYLPEWYPLIASLTSETLFLPEDADFTTELQGLNWPGYFAKDYVKSLNTDGGSLVDTPEQVASVVRLMMHYRGQIEGGVCVRRREEYLAESERRYFVVRGRCFSANGPAPAIVEECASIVASPFFSVDVVLRSDGVLRVVELGDGQVSDRKEWSADSFTEVLHAAG